MNKRIYAYIPLKLQNRPIELCSCRTKDMSPFLSSISWRRSALEKISKYPRIQQWRENSWPSALEPVPTAYKVRGQKYKRLQNLNT
jgi:hypothetical protein